MQLDSKYGIRIFRKALVFELLEEKERKNCHSKTQISKHLSILKYKSNLLNRYITLFFTAYFIYENRILLLVLHFHLFHTIKNLYWIKMVVKKYFINISPTTATRVRIRITVINCAIMKSGGYEYRTKPNLTKPNLTKPSLTKPN